jgi:hypothetical protein
MATDDNPKTNPPVKYDPFKEKHTVPDGWNLSDETLTPQAKKPSKRKMPEKYDPFRDHKIYPKGWDLD